MLRGDLVLAGGGDPLLDTDALGGLVRGAARRAGSARVEGRFLVADGALPGGRRGRRRSSRRTPAYNPTISGMNLNFNRVLLELGAGRRRPESVRRARARFEVPVGGHRRPSRDGGRPRHRFEDGREVWTLPAAPGRRAGAASWLPVRAPARLCRRGLRAGWRPRPGSRCRRRRWCRRAGGRRAGGAARARRSTGCCATCCATRPT